MQTLGLSPTTPKPESRLRTLLWPTVRSESDVQIVVWIAFWVCLIVATTTLVGFVFRRDLLLGLLVASFFFLAGFGISQRSLFAATAVFSAYLLSAIAATRATGQGFGIVQIIFLALLLASVRATWLSARLSRSAAPTAANAVRETFGDKLSDRLPLQLWPKLRWLFYFLTIFEETLLLLTLFVPRHR